MIPIVSIVGKSNSGKTTLVEKLVAELTRRGWRVATIKHSRHGFEIDREGKDSWRHKRAGAVTTVLASPARIAVIEDADRDYGPAEIRDRYIRNADVVLAEGYKINPLPKIEVFRSGIRPERLCGPEDGLIAVAGDRPVSCEVPSYDWNDAVGIADLIEARFLARKDDDLEKKAYKARKGDVFVKRPQVRRAEFEESAKQIRRISEAVRDEAVQRRNDDGDE